MTTTIQQATERLTAARAAYRAELSPVMTRDTEKRDRLAAEVDAAQEAVDDEHRIEAETVAVMSLTAMLDWLACPGTSPCWCDHCLLASQARRIIDDCRGLDFSVEAMAPSSSRARATRRAA